MKVIAITAEKVAKISISGFTVHNFLWQEFGKKELNLRDYDGVIIDLSSVDIDATDIDWNSVVKALNFAVTKDILLSSSSFVIVVGNPFISGGEENIAQLLGVNLKYIEGKGDSIRLTQYVEKSKYKKYLRGIKRYHYSFDTPTATQPIASLADRVNYKYAIDETAYLITRAGKSIAAELHPVIYNVDYHGYRNTVHQIYSGELIFLPSSTLDTTDIVKILLEAHQDQEGDPSSPEWLKDINVSGQERLDLEIDAKQKIIDDASAEKEVLILGRNEIRKPLEILYKSGKTLEESVKEVLRSTGLKITEPQTSDKVEFYIESKNEKFVVEVKSTINENIDQKGLRQVLDWQNDAFDLTGEDYKPLVIASVQYDKQIDERNNSILPANLIEYSVKKNIAVITVYDLYRISQDISAGKIKVQEFVGHLSSLAGLYEYKQNTEEEATI